MFQRDWIEFGDEILQKSSLSTLGTQLRDIIQSGCFYIAVAQYCGPIAVLYDGSKVADYKFHTNYKNSIRIFSNKGEYKKEIQFEYKQKVIYFNFTEDESLLIILDNGFFYIIQPFSGFIKDSSFNVGQSKDKFLAASVDENMIYLLKEKQVGLVKGIGNNNFQPISYIKVYLQNPVISGYKQNGCHMLMYLNKQGNIQNYNLETEQKKILFENPYLKQHLNDLVGISKNKQYFLLVFRKPCKVFYFVNNDLFVHQIVINLVEDNPKQKYHYMNTYEIFWIGSIAFFSDRSLMIYFNSQQIKMYPFKCRIVGQIDGIRVIGSQNSIFRKVPQYYKQIIQSNNGNIHQIKNQQFKSLYEFYIKYINKQIQFFDSMKKDHNVVSEWLDKIVECGGICTNMIEQVSIFKFSLFIMNYFGIKSKINEICNELRIVNNLKYEYLNRCLTLFEFQHLKYEQSDKFLHILLRYNMHFMADMIIETADGKEKIFLHWCKCKIQKQNQNTALEEIKYKFEGLETTIKSTKVFSEMAKYCIERNKISLANNLIDLEDHPGRKIYVLLLIIHKKQQYMLIQKLLDILEDCGDSFMIFRSFYELVKFNWVERQKWVNELSTRKNVQRHYLSFLKETDDIDRLRKYYIEKNMVGQIGLWALKMEANQTEQQLKNKIKGDYKLILPYAYAALISNKPESASAKLRKLKNKTQLIFEQQLTVFQTDYELQYAAQILFEKNNENLAIKCLRRMKSDRVYKILQLKGYFSQAIRLAVQLKNLHALELIVQKCPDDLVQQGKRQIVLLTLKKQ